MNDILLIEDNIELANLISAFLHKEGFSLCHVRSGEEGMHWLTIHETKLLLLDLMLPNMDGFAVCKQIRKKKNTPIVIISAKSTKDDKLMGFELGADDYLEKPVDIDILCAKIKVLMNRFYKTKDTIIHSGALTIDSAGHKVFLHGKLLELNMKEFNLLMLLINNKGKTLHKDYIFNHIWGQNSDSENQTLTVHVKMLRIKIEEDSKNPKRIQTVWGMGYRYEEV